MYKHNHLSLFNTFTHFLSPLNIEGKWVHIIYYVCYVLHEQYVCNWYQVLITEGRFIALVIEEWIGCATESNGN